jgi:LmbE family N-acetylglucosaminyl deacetylase
VALFLSSSVAPQLQHAQTTEIGFADRAARAELHQSLLDLTNSFTVLCVAAHPDDEDGSTLTVLRRKYGVHTVSLFSTYGEGGQNAVGPELYEELGVIRARETMAAAEGPGIRTTLLRISGFRIFKVSGGNISRMGRKGRSAPNGAADSNIAT